MASGADILDVSRPTYTNEFAANFGIAFTSGENRRHTARNDFAAGRIHEMALGLSYTFSPRGTVSFSTDNDYSDAQVGASWDLINDTAFGLNVFGDYGFAFTKNADTHERFGNNNFDFGARVHGTAWEFFQWAFKLSGQYVFADAGNFWNINTTTEAMLYMRKNLAAKAEFNYNLVRVSRGDTVHKPATSLGLVYNMSPTASVHPHVKYHFSSFGGENDVGEHDNFWKIAVAFSIQF